MSNSSIVCQLLNITKSTCRQLSITLWAGASAASVTFALGAFLTSPLELASDQAVIRAQTLCTVCKKNHGFLGTQCGYKKNQINSSLKTLKRPMISMGTHGQPVLQLHSSPVSAVELITFRSQHTCSASLFLL